ncbi:MAG: bifunctional metallophosphatase/5'-nucleotidase, partial [Thermoanaerobaculia bacterium]
MLRLLLVTLLHLSDYHSHALPFYTDAGERGGIARAIHYLREEKRNGALIFSGGDTINKGAPAWSDKYVCTEWPWFNGIVDAMAFGNHDPDYGPEEFDRCRRTVRYPILSANTDGFRSYVVLQREGIRIGVFALAGPDFPQLVKVGGFTFGDPIAAARKAVQTLREKEHVDVVVMIGHQHTEEDYTLAKAVPGIDLIFGSHSHEKHELTRIPGTQTWFIAPGQYLEAISRVDLTFDGKRIQHVRGELVTVDSSLQEDRRIARKVAEMQRALELDPDYAELFEPIGELERPLSTEQVAQRALDTMRKVANADIAISTTSSFRGALASGTLTLEALRAAMPYDNEIVVCTMSGALLEELRKESYVAGQYGKE